MFEVNEKYINRKGEYTVLEVTPPKMKVKFDDGTITNLRINIQERIWLNILAEREAAERKSNRKRKRSTTPKVNYYVRALQLSDLEDTSKSALKERLNYVNGKIPTINKGDRFIFFAIEPKTFFGVATSTGTPSKPGRKVPKYITKTDKSILMLSLDWDAQLTNVETAQELDSVELESQPNFRKLLLQSNTYLKINEDDFELLAELITEMSENDDNRLDVDRDDDDLEDEG